MLKNKSIDIIDEMIEELDFIYCDLSAEGELRRTYIAMRGMLVEAKSRLNNLLHNP